MIADTLMCNSSLTMHGAIPILLICYEFIILKNANELYIHKV